MKFWTWMNIVTILIGPLAWFIFFGIQYNWDDQFFYFQSPYFGAFNESMGGALFWADFFLVIGICMVPSLLEYFAKVWFSPTPVGASWLRAFFFFFRRTSPLVLSCFSPWPHLTPLAAPSPRADIVRELEYLNKVHEAPPLLECKPSVRPPRLTSYDFSQEDNVGRSFFPKIPSLLQKMRVRRQRGGSGAAGLGKGV